MPKTRRNYKVQVVGCEPVTVYNASSPQAACRTAFKLLIKNGQLKRQPKSHEGGFKGVSLWIL